MALITSMLRSARGALAQAPVQKGGMYWEPAAGGDFVRDSNVPAQGSFLEPALEGALSTGTEPFYLRTERLFADPTSKLQPAAPGQQYLQQLRKMPGISPAELQYTGLEEWLPQQKKVTREQVLEFIQSNPNRPEMSRLTLGEPKTSPAAGQDPFVENLSLPEQLREEARHFDDRAAVRGPDSGSGVLHRITARSHDIRADAEEAQLDSIARIDRLSGDTYQRHHRVKELLNKKDEMIEASSKAQQAGNTALAEQLSNEAKAYGRAADDFENNTLLPNRKDRGALFGDPESTQYETYTEVGGENYVEDLMTMPILGKYRSGHFGTVTGQDGYLMHTRQKVRYTPDGEQVTFVEEIQSDLSQAGTTRFKSKVREQVSMNRDLYTQEGLSEPEMKVRAAKELRAEGFTGYNVPPKAADLEIENLDNWEFRENPHPLDAEDPDKMWEAVYRPTGEVAFQGANEGTIRNLQEQLVNNEAAYLAMQGNLRGQLGTDTGLPDTPYKGDDWRTLGFKNELARAIEDDSNFIALTPAWMQKRRYHGDRDQPAGGGGWGQENMYIDARASVDSDGDIVLSVSDQEGNYIGAGGSDYYSSADEVGAQYGYGTPLHNAAVEVEDAMNDAPVFVEEQEVTRFRVIDEDGDSIDEYTGTDVRDDIEDARQEAQNIVDDAGLDEDGEPLYTIDEDTKTQYAGSVYDGDYETFDSQSDADEWAKTKRAEYISEGSISLDGANIGQGDYDWVDEWVTDNYGSSGEALDPGEFEIPYEKALPNKINKYLKQLGKETGERYQLERIDVDVDSDAFGDAGTEEMWGLRITPRLKAHIKGEPGNPLTGGQSMFSVGGIGTLGALQAQQPPIPGALEPTDDGRGRLDSTRVPDSAAGASELMSIITEATGAFLEQYSSDNIAPPGQRSFVEGGMNDLVEIAAGLENALALGAQGVSGVMGALEILGGIVANPNQDTEEVLNRWQGHSYNPRSTQAERQQQVLMNLIRDNPKIRSTLEYLGEVAPDVERSILDTTGSRALSHAGRVTLEMM